MTRTKFKYLSASCAQISRRAPEISYQLQLHCHGKLLNLPQLGTIAMT
jgi:hypothetical protein